MKPIYVFRLTDDGIVQYTITEYEDRGRWYRYKRGGVAYIDKNKMDVLKNGRLCSFNDSLEHATNIIIKDMETRRNKAYNEFLKWDEKIKMLEAEKEQEE